MMSLVEGFTVRGDLQHLEEPDNQEENLILIIDHRFKLIFLTQATPDSFWSFASSQRR